MVGISPARKFKANTSIEEQINSTALMPEIAESMASKEDEEDDEDEGRNADDFNLDMQYVPGKVSYSQKIEMISRK